jgi:hypothetical protein
MNIGKIDFGSVFLDSERALLDCDPIDTTLSSSRINLHIMPVVNGNIIDENE